MDLGVFIPIGNNGWLISENAPRYTPTSGIAPTVGAGADSPAVVRGF